ncbi:hypothetical protein PR048_012004 [Dryococelus australis]|uniref:Uncharacterized protein n=1 Tax=Dryococelus australis TaxID=614101 RepID=A0ABQ9HNT4_9NEOP|nr:hypothetical protein PR048_012004 [Dryococelus australis]
MKLDCVPLTHVDCPGDTRDSKRIMEKVDQRKWSPSKMIKAIDTVRKKKMGWKEGTPEEATKTKRGRPTVLGKDPEELVHYCLAMEASYLGLLIMTYEEWPYNWQKEKNIEHS